MQRGWSAKQGVFWETGGNFDTQMQSRLSGIAVKGIEGKLRSLVFKLVTAPLIAYVEDKVNEQRLKEGELEKAKKWAQTLAEALSR